MSTVLDRGEPRLEQLRARDGVRLAVWRLGPDDGTPVLLVPGTFSNHTFWLGTRGTGLARALAAAGFEAWVLDLRGHGASQRPGPGDQWDFEDWGTLDVTAALRAIGATGRRPFVIGHSGGGPASLAALVRDPELRTLVRGLVIVASPVPWLQFNRLTVMAIDAATRLLGRFPARLLRIGPEDELPGVMIQWARWNRERRCAGKDGLDYGVALRELHTPVLCLAGAGDDFFAPVAACRELFDALGSPDKRFLVLGRDTGYSHDFDHVDVLVGRTARDEVWPRILGWIEERCAAPGAGEGTGD